MDGPRILRIYFIILTITLMKTVVNCVILDATFDKVEATHWNLERLVSISHKTTRGVSLARCAPICLSETGSVPYCYAFSYQPSVNTCDFYSFGTEYLVPLSLELYKLHAFDVFHPISIEGRLYSIYHSSTLKTFDDAWTHCLSMGAYLLHFDSLDEYEAIRSILAGWATGVSFVGANDLEEEGQWVSDKDGKPLDTNVWIWCDLEPNNEGNEDCAVIKHKNRCLNDIPCSKKYYYFCERNVL